MVETATAGGLLVGADRHDFTAGPIASIAAIEAIWLVEPNSAPLRTNSAAYVLVDPTESSAITWSAATQVRGMVNAESNMVVMIPSPVPSSCRPSSCRPSRCRSSASCLSDCCLSIRCPPIRRLPAVDVPTYDASRAASRAARDSPQNSRHRNPNTNAIGSICRSRIVGRCGDHHTHKQQQRQMP